MTALLTPAEAASMLGLKLKYLERLVYDRKIAPEQPIVQRRGGLPGVGPSGWTFTAAEIERYDRLRCEGIDRRRAWNGAWAVAWAVGTLRERSGVR